MMYFLCKADCFYKAKFLLLANLEVSISIGVFSSIVPSHLFLLVFCLKNWSTIRMKLVFEISAPPGSVSVNGGEYCFRLLSLKLAHTV